MGQYNNKTKALRAQDSTNFEVMMLADKFGQTADWRPDFTSKNRLKMSQPQTIFYNTFGDSLNDNNWDTVFIQGDANNTAIAAPTATEKSITMSVAHPGDKVIRQTRTVIPYIPGKEQMFSISLRYDQPTTGIKRRAGLFDMNNGAFFEDTGVPVTIDGVDYPTNYHVCILKNGVRVVDVPRQEWNGDKLDGTGRSGIVAESLAQQLLVIEYEWYGTGMVRFGYIIDNEYHTVHTVYNANNNTEGTWTATPFLPIRVELQALNGEPENSGVVYGDPGTPHYFYQSSSSVVAEGGIETLGTPHNVINGLINSNPGGAGSITQNTAANLGGAGQYKPVLSIRLKSNSLEGVAIPTRLQVGTDDKTELYFVVVKNANLVNATWNVELEPNTAIEADEDADDATFFPGDVISSGFVADGQGDPIILDPFQIGRIPNPDFNTLLSETITVMIAPTGSNNRGIASLSWIEQP